MSDPTASESNLPAQDALVEEKLRRLRLPDEIESRVPQKILAKCDSEDDLCAVLDRCQVTSVSSLPRPRRHTVHGPPSSFKTFTSSRLRLSQSKPLLRKSRLMIFKKSHYIRKPKLNVVKFAGYGTFPVTDDETQEVESRSLNLTHPQPTCSQQALNPCPSEDDTTIEELAAYFDCFVHIPKKMSQMAEMMYT